MKKLLTIAAIAVFLLTVFTGCDHDCLYVSVGTGLRAPNNTATVGVPLLLTWSPDRPYTTVRFYRYIWNVRSAGGTGANIEANRFLHTTATGVALLELSLLCHRGDSKTWTFEFNVISEGTLVIRNESFSGITDVVWNGVPFPVGGSPIGIGSSAERNVPAGTGFIHFRRVTDPIDARTSTLVTVESGARMEFIFLNTTVIVDQRPDTVGDTGRFDELGR